MLNNIPKNKKIFLVLCLIACGYFFAFLFTNIQGCADSTMLSVKNLDEFSQYGRLEDMFKAQENFGATIKNFFYYDYYYYGFIFFFLSWIVIAPIVIIFDTNILWLNILILRQFGVILSICSVFLLVYLWTNFKYYWRSIGIFIFLLTIPAVVQNNLWWHPDSLAILFIILTIFCLVKDQYRYQKFFYWSAVCCGLATGTKLLGVFFFLTIFTYLFYGFYTKKITLKKTLWLGCIFIIIMGLAVIISNPLLLIRKEFNTYYSIQTTQSEYLKSGWVNKTNLQISDWLNLIKYSFTWPLVLLLSTLGLIWGWIQKKNAQLKLLAMLTLTWVIPYTLYVFCTVNLLSWKYLLPALLPLLAGIGFYYNVSSKFIKTKLFLLLILIIFSAQLIIIKNAFYIYHNAYVWTEKNPGIVFYNQIKDKIITSENHTTTIYRDFDIYFPNTDKISVTQKYGTITYADLTQINPDYILLEKGKINLYSNQATEEFIDAQNAPATKQFYQDLMNNKLSNYQILYENDYAIALKKNSL